MKVFGGLFKSISQIDLIHFAKRQANGQQSLTSLSYFAFPESRGRCYLIYLLTIQWPAAEINVIFIETLFEQSVTSSTNNECPTKSGKTDFVGLIKFQ